MKTKLISENGIVEIILTAENEFEKEILEKIDSPPYKTTYELKTKTLSDYDAFGHSNKKNIRMVVTVTAQKK